MSADLKNRLAQRADTTTGTAVERHQQDRPPTAAQLVARAIENQSDAFRMVLPKAVDPDRFSRLLLTAVKSTPQLMECFGTETGKTSILLSAMQAAALGLEPNTPTQDCWLLPRRVKGQTECQLSIGYRGYLRLARRSGTVKTVFAEVVHEKDHFRWERGLEADVLEHRPYDGDGDPGPLTHAYAVARFTNGGYDFRVLGRRDIEARRDMSDSWKNTNSRPYSPWTKWTESMWRKTAIRALVPSLDLSPELAAAVSVDEVNRLRLNTDVAALDTGGPAFELATPEPDDEPESDPVDQGAGGGEAPVDATVVEDDPEERKRAQRALMAQTRKTFPDDPNDQRDAKRHAIAYVALNGRHVSSNDMTGAELRKTTTMLRDVEEGRVTITAGETGWTVQFGDNVVEVPPEPEAA